MLSLMELQQEIEELGTEERAGLASFIISSLPKAPLGPDNEELMKREIEMDSNSTSTISYDEFKKSVGK